MPSLSTALLLALALPATAVLAASISSSTGCRVNGTWYGEGSAMVTSSQCEYCYCIKGQQHCVQPHCVLKAPGCKPEYSKHSCCPVRYHCSDLRNSSATSTTTVPSLTKPPGGCKVNGTKFKEGEKVDSGGGECKSCFCMKGGVRCEDIVCPAPLDTCKPVVTPGHCCPTSYNCSEEVPTTVISIEADMQTTSEANLSLGTTVKITKSEEQTTLEESVEDVTPLVQTNGTEARLATESETQADTTENGLVEEYTATTITTEVTSLQTESSSRSPVRSVPDEIEAIINRTLAKNEDYDYDYNESSLPPSLPNLKIIPFVAADAVVNEQGAYSAGNTEVPLYLDMPQPSHFLPPSKTEGGFVPREPVLDGPFYESKIENFSSNTRAHEDSTLELPVITEPPKLFEEGKCDSDGKTYLHGEVVSEQNACDLCVCYNKEIHCQKPKCNPVRNGCRMVPDKSSCCGKEICDDIPLVQLGNLEMLSSTTPLPETMSNIPAITVADLIATPIPLDDVIRTEPAPDLSNFMKDMQIHLINETYSSQYNESRPYPHYNSSFTSSNKTQFTQVNAVSNYTHHTDPALFNSSNVGEVRNETNKNTSTSDEDYDDSFSFSSVFEMLFSGDTKSKKPIKQATRSSTTQRYDIIYHRNTTEQKQDINNAIENDYFGNNDSSEQTNLSMFSDYQADESKNETNTKGKVNIESRIDTEKTFTESEPHNNSSLKGDLSAGMLKLAGCNIYGRMYRVGRIISELSGPCLECMCTEFGVKCRTLC